MSFKKKCQIIDLKNYLYVVSDDEINEGDWCLNKNLDTLYQIPNIIENYNPNNDWYKVIATTNNHISIRKGKSGIPWDEYLPNLSNSFIQKYVDELDKGNKIVSVMVEYFDCEGTGLSHDSRCETIDCLACNGFLMVDKNNEITITTMKDSWSREDVILLCKKAFYQGQLGEGCTASYISFENWLEKNL